jgi:hypothetical protein
MSDFAGSTSSMLIYPAGDVSAMVSPFFRKGGTPALGKSPFWKVPLSKRGTFQEPARMERNSMRFMVVN